MQDLIRTARSREGISLPNPMVAAAIVQAGRVIATGLHQAPGSCHAEVDAIQKASGQTDGATLYITVEPCTHWGKTPPCTDAIIAAGVRRVVYAMKDPNPKVRSLPAKALLEAKGIAVEEGLCAQEAAFLNAAYLKNKCRNAPFYLLKVAQSLDAKIALASGQSKYITGNPALKYAHQLRRCSDAVLVGIRTVLQDDPQLTVRYGLLKPPYRQPVRVILDSELRLPSSAALIRTASAQAPVLILTKEGHTNPGWPHCEVVPVTADADGRLSWQAISDALIQRKLHSVLIEGGHQVWTSALKADIADKAILAIAPTFLGEDAIPALSVPAIHALTHQLRLQGVTIRKLGQDVAVEGFLHNPLQWM